MTLILLILFLLYLGIMFYIVKFKDIKLALYFIKLLICITILKMIYIYYYLYNGMDICSIILKSWNC